MTTSTQSLAQGVRATAAVLAFALTTTTSIPVLAAPGDITNLRSLSTVSSGSHAYAVNASNHVVGYDNSSSPNRAFLYTPAGGIVSIGTLSAGRESYANDVNDVGVIVGSSWITVLNSSTQRGFRRDPSGTMTPLGTLGGGDFDRSGASAINAAGAIVGSSTTGNSGFAPYHATKWENGAIVDLGVLMAGGDSHATDINDLGHAAGYAMTANGYRPFRHVNGVMTEVPALPGYGATFAEAINDAGVVVGQAYHDGPWRAWKDTPGVGMVQLEGRSPFASNTHAYDINNVGIAVGDSDGDAMLWLADGTAVNLDAWLNTANAVQGAFWRLNEAQGINDAGMVVGYGSYNDGAGGQPDGTMAFLLDASGFIPEPSGLALVALAAGLCLVRSRGI